MPLLDLPLPPSTAQESNVGGLRLEGAGLPLRRAGVEARRASGFTLVASKSHGEGVSRLPLSHYATRH